MIRIVKKNHLIFLSHTFKSEAHLNHLKNLNARHGLKKYLEKKILLSTRPKRIHHNYYQINI